MKYVSFAVVAIAGVAAAVLARREYKALPTVENALEG